jgi:DNA-binding winged helix-turn-helix (wHTH) protein
VGSADPEYEDLVQSSLVNVLATFDGGKFRGECPPRGWAAVIARNDLLRRADSLLAAATLEGLRLMESMRAAGRTVTRDELTAALYQRPATPYERSLDVHISHLRKKLEHEGPSRILTIRGVGYQLVP